MTGYDPGTEVKVPSEIRYFFGKVWLVRVFARTKITHPHAAIQISRIFQLKETQNKQAIVAQKCEIAILVVKTPPASNLFHFCGTEADRI